MSEANKKAAAQAVGLARRKAAAMEAAKLLVKAAEASRKRQLISGAVSLLTKAANKPPLGSGVRFKAIERKARAGGARNPAAVAAAAGIKAHGKKRMAELSAKGRKEAAYGAAPPSMPPAAPEKKPKPQAAPAVPAPARMKSMPTKKPKKTPPAVPPTAGKGAPYMKASEYVLLAAMVKAAADTKRHRAEAFTKAAKAYGKATASGNREHIKKAVARLAAVVTFDALTKEALSPEIGAWLMKLLSKATPAAGWAARKVNNPWLTDKAEKIMQWGSGLGEQAGRVQGLLGAGKASGGEWLKDIIAKNPGAALDLARAQSIGAGTLAGAGGLAAGRYLFPSE